ncbi:hypothetical protein ACTXT7_007999 [Hymenolepis weldensis]
MTSANVLKDGLREQSAVFGYDGLGPTCSDGFLDRTFLAVDETGKIISFSKFYCVPIFYIEISAKKSGCSVNWNTLFASKMERSGL